MFRKCLISSSLMLMSFLITGCEETVSRGDWPLPPEMSQCSVYHLQNKSGSNLTVLYCPHADTAVNYNEGKTSKSVMVINGKKYTEVIDGNKP